MSEQRYTYSFSAWPENEQWEFNSPVCRLFHFLKGRIEDVFTEQEFGKFREELHQRGFLLQEIERVPYHEPERVP